MKAHIGVGLFTAGAALALAQMPGSSAPVKRKAEAAARGTSAKPLFDVKALPGTYYLGDGLGFNLTLKLDSKHRFKFRWTGCLGEYDRNGGSWSLQGDVVVLRPEGPNDRRGLSGMNVRFVPVPWGDRLYLVDEYETPGFAAFVRSESPGVFGDDDVHGGSDYVKVDEAFKLPKKRGKPVFPVRFRDFYEKGAIRAKVAALLRDGTVQLDVGRQGRLRPGLFLTRARSFDGVELEVLSVSPTVAIAKPWYTSDAKRLAKGDAFSTGGRWHRPSGTGSVRYASPRDVPSRSR